MNFPYLSISGTKGKERKSNAQLSQKKSNRLQLLKSMASHRGLSPSSGMHFKVRILPEPVNVDKAAAGIDSFQVFTFFSPSIFPGFPTSTNTRLKFLGRKQKIEAVPANQCQFSRTGRGTTSHRPSIDCGRKLHRTVRSWRQ